MKTFIVDGDKGGVGKSFVARAIADYIIMNSNVRDVFIVDCDPTNPDVVRNDAYHQGTAIVNGKSVTGIYAPITEGKNWFTVVDELIKRVEKLHDYRAVFSLPAGASVNFSELTADMLTLIDSVTVWVIQDDASGVSQLEQRINSAPNFYQTGIVALNQGCAIDKFKSWYRSNLREQLLNNGWQEVVVPAVNGYTITQIGVMPYHLAYEKSAKGLISPTARIAIGGFRRDFWKSFDAAIKEIDNVTTASTDNKEQNHE